MKNEAKRLLESQGIQWRRDWDAVALGFVLGVVAEFFADVLRRVWQWMW